MAFLAEITSQALMEVRAAWIQPLNGYLCAITLIAILKIWDASSVAALDGIEYRYQRYGAEVTIEGLDPRSTDFHQRLTGNFG